MTTEKIISDAETAAMYLRTLVANGVPMGHAVTITSSYVTYRVLAEASNSKPRDPWDPPPT